MASSRLRVLLGMAVLASMCIQSDAALYDKKRGFKALKLSQEDQDKWVGQHSSHAKLQSAKDAESLDEHPVFQEYQAWMHKLQAGEEGVAAAFAGKMPHGVFHHILRNANSKTNAPDKQEEATTPVN